jgi:hypothetical protein
MYLGKKRVGVAENPRSGVGARGSSVKKGFPWGERTLFFGTHVLPLLNLLMVGRIPCVYGYSKVMKPFPKTEVLGKPQ